MGSFKLVKSMNRKLTQEEQKEIDTYWKNNQELSCEQVAKHFEEKYKMPVTLAADSKTKRLF